MSLIEILPVMIVISTLFSFLLGSWGIAHKHTLHSIAARTYAFETFNFRPNVMYFNDSRGGAASRNSYEQTQLRYHGIGVDNPDEFSALTVPIRYTASTTGANSGPSELHTQEIWLEERYQRRREIRPENLGNLNRVWVTVGYGMCINANCGGG